MKEKKIVVETVLVNDTVDKKVEWYTPDGKRLIRSYFLKDALVHGRFVEYFGNGRISYEGNFLQEKKIGKHRYYDSLSGQLEKMIIYQLLKKNDSLISRVNMILIYDDNEEIIESESEGYLEVFFKDTIRQGEDFDFGFKLLSPHFKKADFIICDFDQYYIREAPTPCETMKIKDQMIVLSTKKYQLGKNTVRGIIECYERKGQPKSDSSFITIYYEKDFYVVP